jgi:hypothetical protein
VSKVIMNTNLLTLANSLKVVHMLNKIKAKIYGSVDEDDDTDYDLEYSTYLFEAYCPGLGTNKLIAKLIRRERKETGGGFQRTSAAQCLVHYPAI